MIRINVMILVIFSLGHLQCQPEEEKAMLIGGPMPGYSSQREVSIWFQADREGEFFLEYSSPYSSSNKKYKASAWSKSEHGFTGYWVLENLDPGTLYHYRVLGYDLEGMVHTTPALSESSRLPEIRFLTGSCAYFHDPRVNTPEELDPGRSTIFGKMAKENAHFMIWLGDNLYLRSMDWDSRSGIYDRYRYVRTQDSLQTLLGACHHFAIWDDHDFGPNNSDASYPFKHFTLEAFKDYWRNPNYGVDGQNGITGSFSWGDLDFFLMDNRSFRTSNNRTTLEKPVVWGDHQVEWLINALKSSSATFKVICTGGQFLSDAKIHENHINLAEKERSEVLEKIKKEGIGGVIFLSGDRHHTELSKLAFDDGRKLYDWTVSPLTAKTYDPGDEGNTQIVVDSYQHGQVYGLIKVQGDLEDRKIVLEAKDKNGKSLWTHILHQKELY